MVINLYIMFTEEDQLVLSGGQLLRRASKTAVIVIGNDGRISSTIFCITCNRAPSVNKSQIHFGRGMIIKSAIQLGKRNYYE